MTLSEFQWRVIGYCKHCGSPVYYNDDVGMKFSGSSNCNCQLEGDEDEQDDYLSRLERRRKKPMRQLH